MQRNVDAEGNPLSFIEGPEVSRAVHLIDGAQVLPLVRYSFEVLGVAEAGWRVRRFELSEGISEPYECVLELAGEVWTNDVASLVGASCLVKVQRDAVTRRLCGLVTRVERLGTMIDHVLARVHVRPALAALAQRRDSRVYQGQSVPEIVESLLARGLGPYQRSVRLELDRTYEEREYCVQYSESDLDFARRLMSEEGIYFFFDHAGDQEVLVLTDLDERCPRYEPTNGTAVPMVGPEADQELLSHETIRRLEVGRQSRSTGVVLRDFDWTRPELDLTCKLGGPDEKGRDREVYDYPSSQAIAGYDPGHRAYSRDEGAVRARLRQEQLDTGTRFAEGESNVTGLCAGMVLEVGDPSLAELGTRYLITKLEHRGSAEEEIQHQRADSRAEHRYWNRFTCASHELPYRPPVLARPVMPGPQTAIVVGPAGEEIHTDEHGRIKVQFHWDRQGARDDHSSCWVRVAQVMGGAGFGFLFLPRIGMEVVVQFLDGNPDRPLVTGCVYNGLNSPPCYLPAEKTRSTIKTSSSPGNAGSNELRFEDAAGNEEVYLHAQKVLTEVVEQNHSMTVGGDQTVAVKGNQSNMVHGSQTVTVRGNQSVTVVGDQSLTVIGNQSLTIKGSGKSPVHNGVNIIGKHQMDATDTMEIQAPNSITLRCGGSSIVMEPGKITIHAGDGSEAVFDANASIQSKDRAAYTVHSADVFSAVEGGASSLLTKELAIMQGPTSAAVASKALVKLVVNMKEEIKATDGEVNIEGGLAKVGISAKEVEVNGTTELRLKGGIVKHNG